MQSLLFQLYNFEGQPLVTCATFNSFKNEQTRYKSKWVDTIVVNRTSVIICSENESFIVVVHVLFNLMCLLRLLHHCFSNPNDVAYKYLSLENYLLNHTQYTSLTERKKILLNLCSFPEMCQQAVFNYWFSMQYVLKVFIKLRLGT